MPEPQTRVDVGELLRTIGFASTPGLLRALGALPRAMPGLSRAPLSDRPAVSAVQPGDARANRLQWGFALGVLAVLFLCMLAALNALSSL